MLPWHGRILTITIHIILIFKLHELIVKALGRDVDEAVTMKRMYELTADKMVRICS